MKKLKHLLAIFACAAFIGGCATGGGEAANDAALNAKVQSALKADQYVGKLPITSTANSEGVVTLSGNVQNSFQQYAAGDAAKKVSGVKKVDNKIKVE